MLHCSATADDAAREEAFLFDPRRHSPAVFRHCSALIIKPHAFAAGHTGAILQAVLDAGLEVSGLRAMALEGRDIQDLLEAYKGPLGAPVTPATVGRDGPVGRPFRHC